MAYGRCVAKVMRRADGTPWFHSFAHGRTIYALKLDVAGVRNALEAAAARLDGRDPADEKRQSRRRLVIDRVDDLVETFIREHVAMIGTSRRITSLQRDVIPYWGAKSIHEIKKRHVSDLISLIAQRSIRFYPYQ